MVITYMTIRKITGGTGTEAKGSRAPIADIASPSMAKRVDSPCRRRKDSPPKPSKYSRPISRFSREGCITYPLVSRFTVLAN
jgi:hypothetical protein